MKMKGLYIAFEGIPRSGKSSQAELLVKNLKNDFPNREITMTYEPGGTEIADAIRVLVQGTKFREEMEPVCEAYLYAASRAQALRQVVQPALKRGAVVVADRSFLTSLAYQGGSRGLGYRAVMGINKYAVDDLLPDKVFFFDLQPGIVVGGRGQDVGDKFEEMNRDFFVKARKAYLQIGKKLGKTWTVIDPYDSIENIQTKIYSTVVKLLGQPQLFK